MVVQWLGLCTPTARGKGLIPGWGTKIPHATRYGQKQNKQANKTKICITVALMIFYLY